jgi:hypothetical protein
LQTYLRARKQLLVEACLFPALILLVNVLISRKEFGVEYSAYLESNEGTFIAIIREIATRPLDLLWWPMWDLGLPFQNTYLPGLGLVAGGFSALTGHSPALSFHQVCAAFFCLGPVAVYFMAWVMSGKPGASWLGALAYSILSPCGWLCPRILIDMGSPWNLRRLQILSYYGEGPHTTAMAFLPLAILFLYLARTRGKLWMRIAAGVFIAATVLSNAFGAVILFMAAVSLIATSPKGTLWRTAVLIAAIAVLAYVWISPALPPSVVRAIVHNSPVVTGSSASGDRFDRIAALGLGDLVAGFVFLWWLTRERASRALRFFLLFAWQATAIVVLGTVFNSKIVPQANRYQIAADLGLCLTAVFGVSALLERFAPRLLRPVLIVVLIAATIQARHEVRYGRGLIRSTDITSTAAYRIGRWMDQHIEGQRVLVGGAYSFWFNDFTDTPQLHGGHDPMQPDWLTLIATYTIYSGKSAGARDADLSILWLRALGVRAIAVPGAHSQEYYKPFVNPRKFEGRLPVLWHEGDDTIYGVPVRSASLAHVVPVKALVTRAPVNGLDTGEMERYVEALEDPALPGASFEWRNWHQAQILAPVEPGQAISVQVRYAPGWRARANGQALPVGKDGLGLIALKPACQGPCAIALSYDGGAEFLLTCIASFLVMAGVAGFAISRRRRNSNRADPTTPTDLPSPSDSLRP